MAELHDSPLGKTTRYVDSYTPSLLHSIARADAREALALSEKLPFQGEDVWTGYEFSWLNRKGKPLVSGLRVRVNANSGCIVESKSLKLYLNSFAQTRFESQREVEDTLNRDLSLAFRAPVLVELLQLSQLSTVDAQLAGISLDDLDIEIATYEIDAGLLGIESDQHIVHEVLCTDAFRSLCPVTGQPDWASVQIDYRGNPIDREGLLKYLISYRKHQAFHESTVEQIFVDLLRRCAPTSLTVNGKFLRRGGLDISPYRSTEDATAPIQRLARQ